MSDYSDIINLKYPFPSNHPRMKKENRASQFAPFAALTGYEEKIEHAKKKKKNIISLDESYVDELNYKIQEIEKRIKENNILKFTYFINDDYKVAISSVKKVDNINKVIILNDEIRIKIKSIVEIEGDIFN